MPRVLDLLRHGAALPAGEGGDDARRLSPRGWRDLDRLAIRLAALGWRPTSAFTSPLARARETAAIVLARTAPDLGAEVMDALSPGADPADVLEALVAVGMGSGHALLVGHQPLLGALAASLAAQAAPALSPGTLVRIEFDAGPALGTGVLSWRVSAETLP